MSFFSRLRRVAFCLCASFAFYSAEAGVVINEIMPCNVSTLLNDYYNYTGWLELYNSGEADVNLKGYEFRNITGSKNKLKWAWKIEDSVVVEAGKYKVIFFDEEEGKSKTHAPYKIDSDGGSLILLDNKGNEAHTLIYKAQESGYSFGLNGSDKNYMLPTPGEKNSGCYSNFCALPKFNGAAPGTYNSKSEVGAVTLYCVTRDARIYYTLDGSEPDINDTLNTFLYSGEIKLNEEGNTVIRARSYRDDALPSKIVTGSFIFADEGFHGKCGGFTVPVVSIVAEPDHFYSDQIGIYVKGENGIEGKGDCGNGVDKKRNYNQDWKRPVNFEFIENGNVKVSQSLEAAVMGGCSRGDNRTWKSLKITASKKQGSGGSLIGYKDFFEDKSNMEFKAVQLRNGGNDYDGIRIRDGVMQAILDGMDVDRQAYRPVAFYINGEYGGLFGLRERTNKDYVYSNYGYEEEDLDVIEITAKDGVTASTGTVDYFNEMIRVAGENQSDAGYMAKMSKYMDVNEYVDYMTFEQYIVNTDWPGNNIKVWRERNHGVFRWLVYDTDFGFGLYQSYGPNYCDPNMNTIKFSSGESEQKNWANEEEWQCELFKNLLGNKDFQKKFITRNLFNLKKFYCYDRVKPIIDSMVALASDEYCAMKSDEYYDASGKLETSDEVKGLYSFAEKRSKVIPEHIKEYFKLGEVVDLTISSNVDGARYLINGELYDSSSYKGLYYADLDLSVAPIPPKGYEFDSWSLSASISEVLLSDSASWAYYYDSLPPASDWNSVGFDDSEWSRGKGKFGYPVYDTELKYDDEDNKPMTAYFRTSFNLKDTSAYAAIKAKIAYDDGYVIYVNGKEIARKNMPEGDIDFSTPALEYVNDVSESVEFPSSCLENGVNEIAVEVHQNVKTSSDFVFSMTVAGVTNKDGGSKGVFSAILTGPMEMKAKFVKVDCVKPNLVINEICSSNDSIADDFYGFKPDWIEIVNRGDEPVNLAGLYLTDKAGNLRKSMIPYDKYFDSASVIQPGEAKVVWADNAEYLGLLHLGFKISNESVSTLCLSWEDEESELHVIDSVTYDVHPKNGSYGRIRDGEEWSVMYVDKQQAEGSICGDSAYYTTYRQLNSSKAPDFISMALCSDVEPFAANDDAIVAYPKLVDECVFVSGLDGETAACTVFSSVGAVVGNWACVRDGECINLADLPSGTYILRLISKKMTKNEKILKK